MRASAASSSSLPALPGRLDQCRGRAEDRLVALEPGWLDLGFLAGLGLREDIGRPVSRGHRAQDPHDPAVLGRHGPGPQRFVALRSGRTVELAQQPHQGVVDRGIAAGIGRRVEETAQGRQCVGPEAGAGQFGGNTLELLLAQVDGIITAIADRALFRRPPGTPRAACDLRLSPPVETGGGPA